ncbi:MAG: cysteine desulfurase family protein [Deinococcales bacterium]
MSIYLDYAATTPLDPAVLEAMMPALTEVYGNPSSVHRAGQRARKLVETAREQVAAALGARPRQVHFTSGATEADNQALRCLLAGGGGLVTSRLEHAAVLAPARALADAGVPVAYVPADEHGAIDVEAIEHTVRANPGTRLVALMAVNNETGVRTDIAAAAEVAHRYGALLFCDAVQAFGLEPLDVGALGVDLLAVSAHKIFGPKGAGALYVADGVELPPLLLGGEQERGLRPGTHATPAIVGLGAAAERAATARSARHEAARHARDAFEAVALSVPGVRANGSGAARSVKHSNLRVDGVDGETLLLALDDLGVQASAGSACSAGSVEPSHVLLAMGLSPAQAKASVRFSFAHTVSDADAREAAARFARAVERCRTLAA